MTLRVLGNKVLGTLIPIDVKPTDIYIPPSRGTQPTQLEVVAVGPECKGIKPGDLVMINEFSARSFKHERKMYYVLEEVDVIATF